MTVIHLRRGRHLTAGICAAALGSIACSDGNRSRLVENPVPAVEAALILSDSAPPVGASLVVSVQALATEGAVGSYTARLSYDPSALRYDNEVALEGNGIRASNPQPGLIRFAGAAPTGFAGGRLASYSFVVLRANSARTLSLAVDEMHMITSVDAKPVLRVAPMRTLFR